MHTLLGTYETMKYLLPLLLLLNAALYLPELQSNQETGSGELFNTLPGKWSGEAYVTPVGPRPYDIRFLKAGCCVISGAANPGASVHNWIFYKDGHQLGLRFLSTFQGNTNPVDLIGKKTNDASYVFHTDNPNYLLVRIKLNESDIHISIVKRGDPHVKIKLNR